MPKKIPKLWNFACFNSIILEFFKMCNNIKRLKLETLPAFWKTAKLRKGDFLKRIY